MRWWKLVGLAGLAGVAATGVVTVRAERQRRAYTPDEIRSRLHERVEAARRREAEGEHPDAQLPVLPRPAASPE